MISHPVLRLIKKAAIFIRKDGSVDFTADQSMGDHNLTSVGEVRLTPKASSSGPEGTMFYCDADDHFYGGTE